MAGDPRPKEPRAKKSKRSKLEFSDAAKAEMTRRSGGRCEIHTVLCAGRAVLFHHILRRSQGGKGVASNGLHLCHFCHVYLHDHPAEAYENGWLIRGRSGS